jgi:hypothetical protein
VLFNREAPRAWASIRYRPVITSRRWRRSWPPSPRNDFIGADKIGLRVGKVLGKHKMAKHFQLAITDTTLTIARDQQNIDAEIALDGIT